MENKSVDKPQNGLRTGWLVFVSRLLVGGTFIFSGLVKSIDPYGTVYKFQDYFSAFHIEFLAPYAMLLAVALSITEFLLGVHLLLGSYRKATPRLILALMGVMTPLTLYLAIANPVSDCGCFGEAFHISNWATFFKNVVLLGLTVYLVRYNEKLGSLYHRQIQWLVGLFAMLYAGFFAYVGTHYQPYLEFRPYKIGLNIPEALAAGEPQKEFVFIYERNGEEKEFTMDNLPAEGEGWKFVDRMEKEIPGQGTQLPSIVDFSIFQDDEDVTDVILTDESYYILLLAPEAENADDSDVDLINELYDYSVEQGYGFACVTASSSQGIEHWIENSGAEYPFYFMDKTTIRTIARGNPSVLLLKGGTIWRKDAPSDLPDEMMSDKPLEELDYGQQQSYNPSLRVGVMILIFVVPLFILLLIEKMLLSLLGKIRKARWRRAEKRTLQKQEALIDNEEAVELQEDNQEEKQEQE